MGYMGILLKYIPKPDSVCLRGTLIAKTPKTLNPGTQASKGSWEELEGSEVDIRLMAGSPLEGGGFRVEGSGFRV